MESIDLASRIGAAESALSVSQLAKFLGMSRSNVYDLVREGRIPYIRIGATIRFDPSTTAAWLNRKAVAA